MRTGYITYTLGAAGVWIAWHTETEPPKNATGREIAACPGVVHFAVGRNAEDALSRLHAELPEPLGEGGRT